MTAAVTPDLGAADRAGAAHVVALTQELDSLQAVVDHGLESDARLAAIVESSDDAIIGETLEGIVTSWNAGAERLYGWTAAEMVGHDVGRLTPTDKADQQDAILTRVRRGERVGHFETTRIRKDTTSVEVSVTISSVRDRAGAVIGTSTVARDVTERKESEEAMRAISAELRRSNASLEQFAYIASHDLSEPLRSISGYAELLARRYRGRLDDDADRFIQHTVDGCHRMKTLIDDLLTYSRSGRSGELTAAVDCAEVMADVLVNLQGALAASGGEVEVGPLPVVAGDRGQVAQLWQNLIANALKFARPGVPPRVRVDAESRDGTWVFSVADNGIGIEAAYRDRIFGMFQRLHPRDAYPGTGIGLAICMRIVEAHGGRIWVQDSTDAGTRFCFTVGPSEGEHR
jgi:PAS domain S-box-containing protein